MFTIIASSNCLKSHPAPREGLRSTHHVPHDSGRINCQLKYRSKNKHEPVKLFLVLRVLQYEICISRRLEKLNKNRIKYMVT